MNAAGTSCPVRQATCSARSFAGAGATPSACAQAWRRSWVARSASGTWVHRHLRPSGSCGRTPSWTRTPSTSSATPPRPSGTQ
eukprot:4642832-Alexandrium_andersonii.AAC.1